MGISRSPAGALAELQQNQQDTAGPRSPRKSRDERHNNSSSSDDRGRSPTKSAFSTLSRIANRDPSRHAKSREPSPEKPKKTKSSTNLVGLLSRPKSAKSLAKLAKEDEARAIKDKENRTPPASNSTVDLGGPPTPIFAQFSTQDLAHRLAGKGSFDLSGSQGRGMADGSLPSNSGRSKERPKSFHPQTKNPMGPPQLPRSSDDGLLSSDKRHADRLRGQGQAASERIISKAQRPKIFTAFSASGTSGAAKASPRNPEGTIDPKDIDVHLEDMLDRRNIPENQRFKMRNLSDTIKMEFIRQDWAEMAAKGETANDSTSSREVPGSAIAAGTDTEDSHPKRSRGRSFTLGRSKKDSKLTTKKSKGEGTLGRHFRTKSTESIVSERPRSSSSSVTSSGILSKIKLGQGPGDFVSYLKKVQKPALVEVGKLHKLRLLLRNETVSWAEDFIRQGGMQEIVGLLNRILAVEWRQVKTNGPTTKICD